MYIYMLYILYIYPYIYISNIYNIYIYNQELQSTKRSGKLRKKKKH